MPELTDQDEDKSRLEVGLWSGSGSGITAVRWSRAGWCAVVVIGSGDQFVPRIAPNLINSRGDGVAWGTHVC